MAFTKVASLDNLHERRGTLVTVNGKDIALFKHGSSVFAINNVCAHQHFSMLHEGLLDRFEVTCPMHGWKYDIRTGGSTTGQGKVTCYGVKVVGDDVFIEVNSDS